MQPADVHLRANLLTLVPMPGVSFFSLNSWQLGLLIFALIAGVSAIGVTAGRFLGKRSETYREPIGALQAALLGVVGLILAFSLSLAVGRYQDRRADVVADANDIGTASIIALRLSR